MNILPLFLASTLLLPFLAPTALKSQAPAPTPPATAPASQPALTSKPAELAGLQVTVKLPKPTFGLDEEPHFTLQFKNTSDKPIALYDADWFWAWSIRFEDLDSKTTWQPSLTPAAMLHMQQIQRAIKTRTCHPGETLEIPIDFSKKDLPSEFQQIAPNRKPAPTLTQLPPGQYRLTIQLQLQDIKTPKANYWTGPLTTNPIDFTISSKLLLQP